MLIKEKDIDNSSTSETWLLPGISDSFVHISFFTIHRQDLGSREGVSVYIKDDFKATVINPVINKVDRAEVIWIPLQCRKFQSIITVFQIVLKIFASVTKHL